MHAVHWYLLIPIQLLGHCVVSATGSVKKEKTHVIVGANYPKSVSLSKVAIMTKVFNCLYRHTV